MEGVLVIKKMSVKLSSFFIGGSIVIKNVSVKLFSFINGGSIGDQERVCQTLQLLQRREYWWRRTCLSNSSVSSVEAVLVIKNVSVKLFSFINGGSIGDEERVCQMSVKLFSFFSGGSIGDQERVCQTLQLHQWREYWWWRTCLSNSSVSSMEAVLVIKNVSVNLFSFINGGSIGDEERVCQTLQLLQWREYWWSRTCLSNSSASSTEGVLVMKNVSVKLFSFFSIGDQERVCQSLQSCLSNSSASSMEGVLVIKTCLPILQLLQRREYWWWRTCLSNSSVSSVEAVLVIKNVFVKLFSFINGGSIGDEERVCQTLQFLQWRQYWWSRTCLSNSSASSMEGVLVIKNVSVKLFSFFNGGSIGDQERVCQTLQLLQWREYWWSRTCLSNSSASSMEGVLVIKNVSVKLWSERVCQTLQFLEGGSIGDQERVCHQWREYWLKTCLPNFTAGGSIGDQERVCQTLQLHQWREYWWSRTCLSNSSASLLEGVLVIMNVSVKLFSFFNGGSIGNQECLSNSSASLMEGVLVIKNVSVKLFSFFNGGSIGDQERVCQTLQLL